MLSTSASAGLFDSALSLWCNRLKSKMILKHVDLRIRADGMGPEGASASGHIYHVYRCSVFIVERYTAGS